MVADRTFNPWPPIFLTLKPLFAASLISSFLLVKPCGLFNLHFLAYSTSSNPKPAKNISGITQHSKTIWNQKISKPVKLRPITETEVLNAGLPGYRGCFCWTSVHITITKIAKGQSLDHCLWNAEKSTNLILIEYIYLHTYINKYIPIYTYIYNIHQLYRKCIWIYWERYANTHLATYYINTLTTNWHA